MGSGLLADALVLRQTTMSTTSAMISRDPQPDPEAEETFSAETLAKKIDTLTENVEILKEENKFLRGLLDVYTVKLASLTETLDDQAMMMAVQRNMRLVMRERILMLHRVIRDMVKAHRRELEARDAVSRDHLPAWVVLTCLVVQVIVQEQAVVPKTSEETEST